MQTHLNVLQDTVFKQSNFQSVELPDDEKVSISAGNRFELLAYQIENDHVKVTLEDELKGRNTWTAFKDHIEIITPTGIKAAGKYVKGDRLPEEVNLPVPWFSQNDNAFRPSGTCNVTSVAMCLYYYGIRPKKRSQQLEDELFQQVEARGWDRHVHEHLRKLFVEYGIYDRFDTEFSWETVKAHLANKNPVVVSGQFTKSGHIIVLRGYNDKGFWVNDPYGEWFANGYRKGNKGENLHYSYNLMHRVSYGGATSTWAHLPEKR